MPEPYLLSHLERQVGGDKVHQDVRADALKRIDRNGIVVILFNNLVHRWYCEMLALRDPREEERLTLNGAMLVRALDLFSVILSAE